MWVYKQSESALWTVGFYVPDGHFEPESDHVSAESAARRVAWLNGGGGDMPNIDSHPFQPRRSLIEEDVVG